MFIWWGKFCFINCLFDDMAWHTTWNGKTIRWTMLFKMFKPHYNRWEVGSFFEMIMNPLLEVHVPRYQ